MTGTWSHYRAIKLLYVQINLYGKDRERNGEGLRRGRGIAPPFGKPAGGSRRHSTHILTFCDREQAASPPAPEHGRDVRGPPRGSARAPGSGNHAGWPPWRTRSGAPVPCGWPGLSIPASSAPIPPPCAELRAGWPAPPQECTIPGLFKNVWNSGQIARLFRSRFGKKEIEKVTGAPFSDKRGPFTICYLLFRSP